MDFSARVATKDAARSRRRRSCTPPRASSTLPPSSPEITVEERREVSQSLATTKKSKAVRRRPAPAAQEERSDARSDAPSPAMVSGAPAALRVVPPPVDPDPEVRERAARRRFTAAYKLQVQRQADQCAGVGELGALLRREGLYSSH